MTDLKPGVRGICGWCARMKRCEGFPGAIKFFITCCFSFIAARKIMFFMEADLLEYSRPEVRPAVPVQIRPATAADHRLARKFAGPAVMDGRLERGDICVIAVLAGEIVASAWLTAQTDYTFTLKRQIAPQSGTAYQSALYTLPAFRGLGIGLAVENAILLEARKMGYKKVTQFVAAANTGALHIARKLGYRPVREIRYSRALWHETYREKAAGPEHDAEH